MAPTMDAAAAALDTDTALQRLGNNVDVYQTVVESYLQESAGFADELDRVLGAGDTTSAVRHLHTVKGLAATVGAVGMAAIARAMESTVKSGAPFSTRELCRDFRAALEASGAALELARKALQATPAAPSNGAIDRTQVLGGLKRLAELLANSDMQALEEFSALAYSPVLAGEALEGLNQAMARFDFESARIHCEALIKAMTTSQ